MPLRQYSFNATVGQHQFLAKVIAADKLPGRLIPGIILLRMATVGICQVFNTPCGVSLTHGRHQIDAVVFG
ncbi:hypothetical protein D3C72_2467080 [compost metagenome]